MRFGIKNANTFLGHTYYRKSKCELSLLGSINNIKHYLKFWGNKPDETSFQINTIIYTCLYLTIQYHYSFAVTVWKTLHILVPSILTINIRDIINLTLYKGGKQGPESISKLLKSQNIGKKQGFELGNIVIHAFNHYFMLPIE